MKASILRANTRTESRNDRNLGIQTYGQNNDYPQRCKMIADASGTAATCIEIYTKFIRGKGFADKDFYKETVNTKGQTSDYILQRIVSDFATYGGFALHLNYNGLLQIAEVQHIPFEHIRFEKIDDNTGTFGKVAIHPDWGRQYTNVKPFSKDDIKYFDLYTANPEQTEAQIAEAGGLNLWGGQVYYYSNRGDRTYPTPIYDAVLTDMSSEEGVSNIKYRNARNNFLSAGVIVEKRNKAGNGDSYDNHESELSQMMTALQTDENACKIGEITVESEEEIPQFISFQSNNYDKEFTYTEQSIQQNIGRRFNIPPVLRAEDVSAGFGADLIINAYNVYNSATSTERLSIEMAFAQIFGNYVKQFNNFTILPLTYVPQITPSDIPNIINVVKDPQLAQNQKAELLKLLFNISDEDAQNITHADNTRRHTQGQADGA